MLETFHYFIQKLIQINQQAFADLVHKTGTLSTHNSLFNWKHNHKHFTLVCARRSPKFDWKSLRVPKVWSHFDVCDGFVSLELNGKKQQKLQKQHSIHWFQSCLCLLVMSHWEIKQLDHKITILMYLVKSWISIFTWNATLALNLQSIEKKISRFILNWKHRVTWTFQQVFFRLMDIAQLHIPLLKFAVILIYWKWAVQCAATINAQIIRLMAHFKAMIYSISCGILILLQCDKPTTMIITLLLSTHKSKEQ